MVGLNSSISVSVLNVHRLCTLIKRQRFSDWIKIKHTTPKYKHTERMKVKGRKNVFLTK